MAEIPPTRPSLLVRLRDRTGPLEAREIVRIGLQTALGLAAAHAQGLIHRDIKPANLLLEGEPAPSGAGVVCVKITDFGLARLVDDVGLTQTGVVAGTPEYMSPEQARAEPVDHRSDLFSLGSVLYALCTGVSPFRDSSPLRILRQVCDQAPRPIRSLNPNVPLWLEALVSRLLAKNPADRFQSAAEVAELLGAYLAHLQQPALSAAPDLPPSPSKWFPRPFWLAAILLLLGLGLGWLALGGDGETRPGGEFQEVYHHDFRGQPLPASLTYFGNQEGHQYLKEEPEGLHITLPRTYVHPWGGIGVQTAMELQGDFEVTTTVEMIQADRPPAGIGAGVGMRIEMAAPARGSATLGRMRRPDGQQSVWWDQAIEGPDGKRRYPDGARPCSDKVGRLRLQRTGATLRYLWGPGTQGEEFEEYSQCEFGTNPISLVRLTALTGQKPCNVDVRLIEVRIRSATVVPPPPPARSRNWLLAAVLLSLGLAFVWGVWFYVHRLRAANRTALAPLADGEVNSETADSSVSLACSGCGKNLKVRAELAGKKVKCPQCGQAVRISAGEP